MKTKQMKVYESWNSIHKRNPKICMEDLQISYQKMRTTKIYQYLHLFSIYS